MEIKTLNISGIAGKIEVRNATSKLVFFPRPKTHRVLKNISQESIWNAPRVEMMSPQVKTLA